MDGEESQSPPKWEISNTFPLPEPWSWGKIAGTLKFIDNKKTVTYQHFNGKEEIRRMWSVSSFGSEEEAYSVAHAEVYAYCSEAGVLLNEVRRIAPGVLEMKVGSMTTIFDQSMVDIVYSSTWHIANRPSTNTPYFVEGRRDGQNCFLHKLLLHFPDVRNAVHKNRNGLDNRLSNLEERRGRQKSIPVRESVVPETPPWHGKPSRIELPPAPVTRTAHWPSPSLFKLPTTEEYERIVEARKAARADDPPLRLKTDSK